MEIFKKLLLVFVLGACTTSSVIAETQFSRGKSWLSKNTYCPVSEASSATSQEGRRNLMSLSSQRDSGGCRTFDLTISMYKDRSSDEQRAVENVISNFAKTVYEATDGMHRIGKVWILGRTATSFCDVTWGERGLPRAGLCRKDGGRIFKSGQIQMFDVYDYDNTIRNLLSDSKFGGAELAHEWSHAQYGLGDEYEMPNEQFYWQRAGVDERNGIYYLPHGGDSPVTLSLMNSCSPNFGHVVAALNFSISANANVSSEYEGHKGTGYKYVWDAGGRSYFVGATSQYRMYGKSAWEQLKDPAENPIVHCTTPKFEEFSGRDVNAVPSYELNQEDGVHAALSDIEIIWAIKRPVIAYLCIDLSGSMSDQDVNDVKNRALSVINAAPNGTIIGVATFADHGKYHRVVKLTALSDGNRSAIKSAIVSIQAGNGSTALWDAAMEALKDIELFAPGEENGQQMKMSQARVAASNIGQLKQTYGAASVILLSDGQDNDSTSDCNNVISKCKELGVAFNTIGYGAGADNEGFKTASESTGGQHYESSREGNSLTEAFLRQFTHSSFRVVLADYTYKNVLARLVSRSFFVDQSLTNVNICVAISKRSDECAVNFVSPCGKVHQGSKTENDSGTTFDYLAASCEPGEWRVEVSTELGSDVTIYADANSCDDNLCFTGDVVDDDAWLVVSLNSMHSITGAQVLACIPCDGFVREVPFKEKGCGCYFLELAKCGPEAAESGLSVCCNARVNEAYVNYEDGLVSPALKSGSESVKESKTRVIHFTPDELQDACANVQTSGDAVVSNVKISSRWPFDSRIDIDFTVTCEDCEQTRLIVVGYDHDLNRQMTATTLSGTDLSNPIGSGTYRVTWDIGKDYPGFHAKKFSVSVFSAYAQVDYDASHGGNGSGVELSWTDFGNGSVSYQIWRSTQSDVSKADLLATVKSGPYVDTTAIPGVLYYYWIRAIGSKGFGDFGYPRVGYRDIDAPMSVQASDGTSSEAVEVFWSAVKYSTAYEVWRGTAGTLMCCEPERLAVVTDTHYSDASAIPGVDYWYWIRTRAPACASEFGENDQGYRDLAAPTDVSATDGTSVDGVTISWGGSVPGVEYEVYSSETPSLSDAEFLDSCMGSTLTDAAGNAGHAYYYWVRAVAGSRKSDFAGPDRGWCAAKLSGTALYLVIDVSEGASAKKYPFYELNAIPGGKWSDEYKMTKIVLRRCSAGNFYMGSPSGETGRNSANEKRHKVTLTQPFYLGVFEITQAQWTHVIGSNPSRRNGEARVQCPVEAAYDWIVPGKDAISFVGQLRSKTGLSAFNLPTEAQWEYACRAGTTTAINTGKSLSSQYEDANMSQVARYMYTEKDNGLTRYNRVGCYLPNAWGFYDMHGNVAEWCMDYYVDSLGTAAKTDPTGPTSGTMRVLRGGSYADYAKDCRSASRKGAQSRVGNDGDEDYVGFRLFKSIP